MLAITDLAAEAIKNLAVDARLPDGGGLRITAPSQGQGALELSLAGGPAADDVVLSGEGVTVFLEPLAAQVLDDKVLDVAPTTTADGARELRFSIAQQEPPG